MSDTTRDATRCGLAAWQTVNVSWSRFDELRKGLLARGSTALGQACKLSDEQTLLAIAAVLQTIDSAGWQDRSFAEWGVVAAPQYLGRLRMSAVIDRFSKQEVRGASPLTVPHLSLHAVAATISVILGSQGPSFGVGGSTGIVRDALLSGICTVRGQSLPGVWLVASQWTPEPNPDTSAVPSCPIEGLALAMAIVPAGSPEASCDLVIRRQSSQATSTVPWGIRDLRDWLGHGIGASSRMLPLAAGITAELAAASAEAVSTPARKVA